MLCNKDSECLSNKCYNNHCCFNNENEIEHCDNIYSNSLFLGESSYMYCGKRYLDTCKSNKECSSKKCLKGICTQQIKGPSDSYSFRHTFQVMLILLIVLSILIILIILCIRNNNLIKKDKIKMIIVIFLLIGLILYIGF